MLYQKMQDDIKSAMKAKDEVVVSTLRMLSSAIMYHKLEKKEDRRDVSDSDVESVAQKEIKKRRESVELYRKGGREEQAAREEREIEVLSQYVPEQLGEDEVRNIVKEIISETGVSDPGDMGKVMGPVMGKLKGKADGNMVGKIVREELS